MINLFDEVNENIGITKEDIIKEAIILKINLVLTFKLNSLLTEIPEINKTNIPAVKVAIAAPFNS